MSALWAVLTTPVPLTPGQSFAALNLLLAAAGVVGWCFASVPLAGALALAAVVNMAWMVMVAGALAGF